MENVVGLEAAFEVRRNRDFNLRLSLSIPPGKTAALVGPNGAGKTTAVAAIAGLIPIERGYIRLAHETLDDPASGVYVPPEKRRVGVVFQDYLLFPHLSVMDNIAFGLRNRGAGKEEARSKAGEWMERMGLTALARRRPRELSGGQAQRVALARALITEPDLLLLDEPLAALDVSNRIQLRRTLSRHLESFPGPRLVITHEPAEAFLLADEINIIEEGVITQGGTADDIRIRPRTVYAADLAGSNLLMGTAAGGEIDLGGHRLHVANHPEGEVLVTIRASAVSLHRHRPDGSPRNTWPTKIELMEPLGERVRLRTGPPLALTVEITAEAVSELALVEGEEVWVAIKATEIGIESER